ncbi:MAG: DUF3048 domain-containing protein [Bacilli bacterium]|nr:DUF3048 domain-containing protein [Bacilli bacterium]
MAKHAKKRKKKGVLFLILFLLIALAAGGYYYYYSNGKELPKPKLEKIVKKLKIVDENSKSRPIAVMINNNHQAWPHAGLDDAYITYEIIAEGGITRMMAVFKDKDTAKIGSVRSARPYYLDYALENDAIYVHYGWSDQAKADIASLGVDNINGLTDSSVFWRDTTLNKAAEHTAFTSMEKIKAFSKERGYDRDTDADLLLNYSIDEISLKDMEGAVKADKVYIKYSYYTDTSYEYDEVNKVYLRSMSGVAHKDAITGNQYTAKNIIVTPIESYAYDSYGRQKLNNIGSGEGYYITLGYAIPITWEKSSRSSQTVYKYKDSGKEIKVNDGNTYIQIQPKGEALNIEGVEEQAEG